MAFINDEKVDFNGTILELLEKEGYDKDKVVVLLNGEIVKKDFWNEVFLKQDDYLEVVTFVGGG